MPARDIEDCKRVHIKLMPIIDKWDARFYVFQKLSALAGILIPETSQYTKEQCDALHVYADLIARTILDGSYEYTPRSK